MFLCTNVHFRNCENGFLKRSVTYYPPPSIGTKTDSRLSLEKPYKLCDYRKLYGAIFQDYLGNYEFWGYCDIDVIFGDLDSFISDEVLSIFDKIGTRGHLTLYRNIQEFKSADWLFKGDGWIRAYERFALTHKYASHIDESPDVDEYLESKGFRIFDSIKLADVEYQILPFRLAHNGSNVMGDEDYFCFDHGCLFAVNNSLNLKVEFAYVHFQKRLMQNMCGHVDSFYMIPNAFVPNLPPDISIRREDCQQYEKKMQRLLFAQRIRRLPEGLLFRTLKQKYN